MRLTMKYCTIFLFSLIFLSAGFCQRRDYPPDAGQARRPERLEKFRKMRLIEVLQLKEDDAVRFFAKQSAHEDKQRDLMKERNNALDEIETTVKDKHDDKKLDELTGRILDLDRLIFEERQRYQNELKGFLTPEQFAKFLAFERNFGRQVRSALEELHEDRRSGPGD